MSSKSRFSWNKTQITTPNGVFEAIEPIIVSASRATDVPAFYIPQFLDSLRAGFLKWVNPFNNCTQYINLAGVRAIVFWSKYPRLLLEYMREFEHMCWYLTQTINDYEADGLEPNLPPLDERIESFAAVSRSVGPLRVIWRADPLILLENLGVEGLLDRVRSIAKRLCGLTFRLTFSFADILEYKKVAVRMNLQKIPWREWDSETMRAAAVGMAEIGREFGFEVVTCAEKCDFGDLGIQHGACVDGVLLQRLFLHDERLAEFLQKAPKDPGQRKACRCIPSKDIGRYNTCKYECLYCYAR